MYTSSWSLQTDRHRNCFRHAWKVLGPRKSSETVAKSDGIRLRVTFINKPKCKFLFPDGCSKDDSVWGARFAECHFRFFPNQLDLCRLALAKLTPICWSTFPIYLRPEPGPSSDRKPLGLQLANEGEIIFCVLSPRVVSEGIPESLQTQEERFRKNKSGEGHP